MAAETNAMPITVMAEAEKQAATNKAEATNVLAKADAATTRAAGVKALGQAEAEAASLKAEARNKLSPSMIDYDLNLARINIIPNALAEAVKPIEKISDIRIFDTGSLLGRGGGACTHKSRFVSELDPCPLSSVMQTQTGHRLRSGKCHQRK
jgi:flotillin